MIEAPRGMVVGHCLVALSILPGVIGMIFKHHFPWACSVLWMGNGDSKLIGACTIFDKNKVLVSADNLNELGHVDHTSTPRVPFYTRLTEGEVFVHAGSDYMNLDLVNPKPEHAQKRKAVKFYVAFGAPDGTDGSKWDIRVNPPPPHIGPDVGASYDALGLSFNVGILELSEEFTLNPFIQPIRVITGNISSETNRYLNELKNRTVQVDTCVTYSWNQNRNRIRHHEVMLIDKDDSCVEMYCQWKLSNCTAFPKKSHLECFKSTVFMDVCPSARGAALWCKNFGESVLAILTTAPSCGLRKIPGVYTTLPKVVEFFENAYKEKFNPGQSDGVQLPPAA